MAEDREQAIEAISELSRGMRARSPRWLWGLALGVGVVCAIAFGVAMVRGGGDASGDDGDAAARETLRARELEGRSRGLGFTAGLVVGGIGGGIAGVVLGMGIARQLRR